MRAVWLVAVTCAGCPVDEPFPIVPDELDAEVPPPDETIEIHGRVVDFESCPIPPGCESLEGVVVEAVGTSALSAPTGRDGAFLIREAPRGQRLVLAVAESAGYARTLAAEAIAPTQDDVFDVLLYVMPQGEGTLLEAIEAERGLDLSETGGYVGQVIARIEEGADDCPDLEEGFCAVEGASASVRPDDYGSVVYVNALPSFVPGEPVLLDTATSTNSSGLFLVLPAAPPGASELDVEPTHPDIDLDWLQAAPVQPGAVTVGFHRSR